MGERKNGRGIAITLRSPRLICFKTDIPDIEGTIRASKIYTEFWFSSFFHEWWLMVHPLYDPDEVAEWILTLAG